MHTPSFLYSMSHSGSSRIRYLAFSVAAFASAAGAAVCAHQIATLCWRHQTWNFIACVALDDLRKVEMLVHHALTAAIAVLCLHPFLHGFGFFFFGVVELTNLPLNMVEMLMLFQHAYAQ